MRLYWGAPPEDPDFHPARDGWIKLREPDPILLQIIAIPVAGLTVVVLLAMWIALAWAHSPEGLLPSMEKPGDPGPLIVAAFSVVGVVVAIPLIVALHELLHAICFPGGLNTPHSGIGMWPSRLLFYACYLGPMSRNRFLLVYSMPLLVLTVLPLFAAALIRMTPVALAGVSILNGVFACGDLVCISILAWQVPRHATVRNQGWETWWKRPGESTIWLET